MNKLLLKDILGWGFVLWLVGYILGIVLFVIVPNSLIGWIIMPIGTVITLWVLFKKVKSKTLKSYVILSLAWTLIAVVFDYIFIVKMFNPADGYYKLDVYLYYIITFMLPIIAGLKKK